VEDLLQQERAFTYLALGEVESYTIIMLFVQKGFLPWRAIESLPEGRELIAHGWLARGNQLRMNEPLAVWTDEVQRAGYSVPNKTHFVGRSSFLFQNESRILLGNNWNVLLRSYFFPGATEGAVSVDLRDDRWTEIRLFCSNGKQWTMVENRPGWNIPPGGMFSVHYFRALADEER
jgi:hypothetical protein